LLRQAYTEVFNQQLEEVRLQEAFDRISKSKIIVKYAKSFTPLSFPLKVDSLRGTMSNENLDKRIQRIKEQAFKIK
jgi:ATP-dependent Lhr-like helicase